MLKDIALYSLSKWAYINEPMIHGSRIVTISEQSDPYENSYILKSISYAMMGYAMENGYDGIDDFAKGLIDEINRLYP